MPSTRRLWPRPASRCGEILERLHLESPRVPIVANVNGEFYPTGPDVVPQMLDILAQQVASPVQFVKGLRTLYDAGARVFVEVGPKKALQGFAEDVLGDRAATSFRCSPIIPRSGDIAAFNQALCGLYAAGLGRGIGRRRSEIPRPSSRAIHRYRAVTLTRGSSQLQLHRDELPAAASLQRSATCSPTSWIAAGRFTAARPAPTDHPVAITGAALGLPGTDHIFDDGNVARILRGDQFIDAIPTRFRRAMLDKHITRLVKSDNGGPTFESIHDVADVIKLAGRGGAFDLEKEFGVSADRVAALDRVTQPGDRRGHRRPARCRHPAGHALQDHHQRHAVAGSLGIAGRSARRYGRDLRLGVPGLRLVRRRAVALLRGPRPPRAVGDAGRPARAA